MEFGIHTLYNFTNLNLFGRFYYPFIKKFHLFIRMKPMLSIFIIESVD